jgi:hypothetical protein
MRYKQMECILLEVCGGVSLSPPKQHFPVRLYFFNDLLLLFRVAALGEGRGVVARG